jgi:hypothetical protein
LISRPAAAAEVAMATATSSAPTEMAAPAVDLDGGAERAVAETEHLVKCGVTVRRSAADVRGELLLDVGDERVRASGLTGLRAADAHVGADGRRLAEVVIEADHAMHVRAREVQLVGEYGHDGLVDVAERGLDVVQDRQ